MAKRLSKINTSHPSDQEQMLSPMRLSSDSPASAERGRLHKAPPSASHSRSTSAQVQTPTQPSLQQLKQTYAHDTTFGAPSPLLPPPVIGEGTYSRSSSLERSLPGTPTSYGSRPSTPTLIVPGQSPTPTSSPGQKEKRKSSWFSKSKKDKDDERRPPAWIIGHPQQLPYDLEGLVNGRPMPELWDDNDGNCHVYLFPRASSKGPSFKIDSAVFSASPVLARLAFGERQANNGVDARRQMPLDTRTHGLSLNDPQSPPMTPEQRATRLHNTSPTSSRDSRGGLSNSSDDGQDSHLYIPIKFQAGNDIQPITQTPPRSREGGDSMSEDAQTLIDIRNFFAFLCGQSLVATEKRRSFFHIFMTISAILKSYAFDNGDGSTFGNMVSSSFDNYVHELGLADVRMSREKTIEGIILGERMKSVLLYNEAFTHAAGKYEDIVQLKSSKFSMISAATENRLVRASMDLDKRIASIRLILTDFEFPSLFRGIMASKVSEERKEGVRFEAWRDAFMGFRRHYISLLKQRYGAWPPKASSKKNDLETSGLNRLVLRDVYADMCAIYDLLVDKSKLTTRTVDGIDHEKGREEPTIRALRAVLNEYDCSSPPVKPPVPFDVPKLPSLKATRPEFGTGDKKSDIKAIQKKVRDDEIAQIIRAASNEDDPELNRTPFQAAFREYEAKASHGCNIWEMLDLRLGQWLFMYVVLQALPLVVMDAPGMRYTKGCEYFLCEESRGALPWAATVSARNTSVGGQLWVPAEETGAEGAYRRSHCWIMADKWRQASAPVIEPPSATTIETTNFSRPSSRLGRFSFDEPLPPPPSNLLSPDSRPSSRDGIRGPSFGFDSPERMRSDNNYAFPTNQAELPLRTRPSAEYPRPRTPQQQRVRPLSAIVPQHTVDSSKTFDAILAGFGEPSVPKKGKK